MSESSLVGQGVQLSLCMIVRDEEKNIRACLESINPYVDEMIVVDTGSRDATPQIAMELGAKVSHFAWCDDFAAARNESLKRASGKWLFWMDADDTIDPENGAKLQAAAREDVPDNVLGRVMQVHCPGEGDEAESGVTIVDHIKLIRNRPEIHFEGRVHEQVLPSIRRLKGEVTWADVAVVHSQHDHSPAGQAKKHARDLGLLELDIQERPDHPFVLFNLGMTYTHTGDMEKAIAALSRCTIVSHPDESHLRKAYALLAGAFGQVGRREVAWAVCQTGRRLFPDDAELLFREGDYLAEMGDLPAAEQAYRQLLSSDREKYFSSFDRGIVGFRARQRLAEVLSKQGKHDEAAACCREVLSEQPGFLPAQLTLVDSLVAAGQGEEALAMSEAMIGEDPTRKDGYGLRARVLVGADRVDEARASLERAVAEHPRNEELFDELCAFLFQHGPLDAAEHAIGTLAAQQPNDASVHHNLGTILLRQERFEPAINAYHQSLMLRPEAVHTRLFLGQAQEKAGLIEEAAATWREAVQMAPGSPVANEAAVHLQRLGL